ncbi:IclR family transcriptional regulator [Pseudonocardia sediminis]|uniref:IclR family transcriptional regulator n=1 Tax=Pseudonocardia sediminis TaxID=1397368 RepID=A0A4Q7UU05_PSEST|nr:IclR family transcriptional regulator C-terminal domain-containing protein [Pseudonocardia sediminis]RZT83493.1 IclR family transcriptional regulator [Pseudonocardia sediminis]
MDQPGDRDRIQSLERGFAVLNAFDEELPRPTLAELAAVTGLSRPAVRRILITLQHLGYVTSTGPRWSLTPRVLAIGQHYTAAHALIESAQPHLLALAERTGESASLAELDGGEVVYVARVPVRRIMTLTVSVGTRVPAHATSMGRVLLAWADPERVSAVLGSGPLARPTARTTVDPDALRAELARVREQGFSIVAGELEEGLISASAPVQDRSGRVVAALASSTSAGRSTAERLRTDVVPLLVETARAVGAELTL